MACQWRQVATGRNRPAARGQKQSVIWRKLATAEAEIEQGGSPASADSPVLEIKTHHAGGGYRREKKPRIVSG